MKTSKRLITAERQPLTRKPECSVLDRIEYLIPTRYFRFYLFSDPQANVTCWLPQGFAH